MKAKYFKFLGLVIAPAAIIFPILNYNDSSLKIVDLEGSGSLFDPILTLTKEEGGETQFNILPTGSAGGKESLNDKSINLALTSLSSKQPESGSSANSFKEARIAEDPIMLVHKKGSKCSLLQSEPQNSELPKGLFDFSTCKDIVLFLREGGYDRSNLNKTVLSQDSIKDFNAPRIREVPENNFLAFEKFRRENYSDAIIFFPKSFVELNKDEFSGYETKELKAQANSNQQSPSLQKELNLLYRKGEDESKNDLWDLIKKILLKAKGLKETFKLTAKSYCDSSAQEPKCNTESENPKAEDINELKKK